MEQKRRIGNVTAGFMIIAALLIDAVQGLLTLSVLLLPFSLFFSFLAFAGFGIWFMLQGVSYTANGGKKLLIGFASVVTELAPFINALPAVTLGVVGIIIQTRIEDARENAEKSTTPKTATAQARRMRMNAARSAREDAAREERDTVQQARHAPSEDAA